MRMSGRLGEQRDTLRRAICANSTQVILAFTISAFVTLIWAIFAYRFGLIPADLLRTADRKCFRANSRRVDTQWRKTFEGAVVTFSDQHIITGISIMIAAYANLFPGPSGMYGIQHARHSIGLKNVHWLDPPSSIQ